jgi:hypothetical protein
VAEYLDSTTGQMVALMPGGTSTSASVNTLSMATSLRISARVVAARITKSRVDSIEAALVALRPNVGPYDYVITFDHDLQVVIVQSDAPPSAFAQVLNIYGSDVQYQAGGLILDSRTSDTSPYWGGAAIRGTADDGGYEGCTAGFAVQDSSGHKLMVTAGHCFASGSVNNYKLVNNSWVGGGAYMGAIHTRSQDYDDEEYDGRTYAGDFYTTDTTHLAVLEAGSFGVGASYCLSGAYSGASGPTCGHTDQSNSTLICESYGVGFCFHAADLTGGVSPQGGDSGGPWYIPYSGKAGIRGSHVGDSSTHWYATPWTGIRDEYPGGLTIVTG